jgi:hypothetical protein
VSSVSSTLKPFAQCYCFDLMHLTGLFTCQVTLSLIIS